MMVRALGGYSDGNGFQFSSEVEMEAAPLKDETGYKCNMLKCFFHTFQPVNIASLTQQNHTHSSSYCVCAGLYHWVISLVPLLYWEAEQ